MIDGILPASGLATRMRGLPKFLLPAGPDYETLIERHIRLLAPFCDRIWIPTRPDLVPLLSTLGLSTGKVLVIPMKTISMTQTIMQTSLVARSSRLVVIMPDTFFAGEQPYEFLSKASDHMNLAVWRIRADQSGKLGQVEMNGTPEGMVLDAKDKEASCNYPHAWGAMSFDSKTLSFASEEMPHTGYMLPELIKSGVPIYAREIAGSYYDCGTPKEYIRMLGAEVGEIHPDGGGGVNSSALPKLKFPDRWGSSTQVKQLVLFS